MIFFRKPVPTFRDHARVLVLAAALAAGASVPAAAQFGGLFDPPRPPSDVPSRPPARQVDPRYQSPDPYPAQPQPTYQQPAQQPTYQQPTQQAAPATPFQPAAPDRGVQSQPLPPPPGAAAAPPPQPPAQQGTFAAPPAGQPPAGQTPPATNAALQPGANAALQPGDEVVTTMPTVKITNPTAVFSGLDKITGRITTFEAAINETVEFGALRVTPRACYTRPPTEPQNTDGFLEVDEITLQGEARRIFTGWMFAASPGLHAVEHPIYDVWLTDCKGGDTTVAGVKPPEPEPPPPAPPPTRRAPAKKR